MTLPEPVAVSEAQAGDEPLVSFVLPAYNEEARLPASLDHVIEFAGRQPYPCEIVVADDGSRDRTPQIVRDRMRQLGDLPGSTTLLLVHHETNRGKGAAIRTGMLAATGRYVFFMDADLATPPEETMKLLARLRTGAPVAIGSRIQDDGSDMRASQPFRRRLLGRVFTLMRKMLRVLPDIDDTQCPMKGFSREAARAIFERQRLSGWIFDAEVLFIARQLGYSIAAVPVRWEHVEGSRLNLRPQQVWEVLRDLVRLRFTRVAR
jgi:dolichyl-phosphate beta-glucosyltransferase